MVSSRRVVQADTGWRTNQAGGSRTESPGSLSRVIGLLAILSFTGDAAFADFLVQPMVIRRMVQPGRRVTIEMKLENTDPQKTETISLSLAELSQDEDAAWRELSPDDPNLAKFPVRSCRSWIMLPPSSIAVAPYRQVPFTVQIDVPPGTRGYYFAALIATTAPGVITEETGIVTMLEIAMVVPVILEVQGIPMTHKISLGDIGLQYRAETPEVSAANYITTEITNSGGTFSTIMPVVKLWGQFGGLWRKVLEQNIGETGIMPGAKVRLRYDIGRLLASGTYRMEGCLYVDGRRGNVVTKELVFKGDERVLPGAVVAVALEVQPEHSFLEIVPGATRSASIQVVNASEMAVNVDVEFGLPPQMESRANARGVRGDDLSCADWVTVEPRRLSMRGYSRTNLRILARMPKGAAQYPCYYGLLRLRATYPDGQLAGIRETYICVQNKQTAAVPMMASTLLTIAETGPSRYMVTAGYMNGGETYLTPSCQGDLSLAGVGGVTTFKRFLLSSEAHGQKGILFPFEARSFSGVLDLSDVPANTTYYLTSVLRWPGGPADGLQEQRAIVVSEQGGRKFARMTEASQRVPIKLQ